MKKKNTIGNFLFKNSILIVLLSVAIFFLSVAICKIIFESVLYRDSDLGFHAPSNINSYPLEKPDTKSVRSYGGWVEILDENYKVVYVDGIKREDTYQYKIGQLFLDSSSFHNNSKQYPYIYNIYPFTGSDSKAYLYMIILPKTVYHVSIGANLKSVFLYPNGMVLLTLAMVSGIFLLLFLAGMVIYSKFTAKHIKTPLKYLMDGIRELENHNYRYRMDFYGESEFARIRDAFNSMAERLETVEKEKKQIEDARHRMLVDISHDLKTPMTSICGFSGLLYEADNLETDNLKTDNLKTDNLKTDNLKTDNLKTDNLKTEDRRKYTEYIYHKSRYVSELIQDLFELSKLEEESFRIHLTGQDFLEWLRITVSESYAEFERKEFTLDIEIAETPVFLKFDEIRMRRALNNLLTNALVHNPEKTCVKIICYREKDMLILKIGDNGRGIPEELRESIFNPFVKAENEGSYGNGTGLGLAITKKIIEKHGGTIELTYGEGMGTLFLIRLPLGKI